MYHHESLLIDYVAQSNLIEGIRRPPTPQEVAAHRNILELDCIEIGDLSNFVNVCQPGAKLRSAMGMDVRVGDHIPPFGGPEIVDKLRRLLKMVNEWQLTPVAVHVLYERLHPYMDGNGRSGRALYLWQVTREGVMPHDFLKDFYLRTLREAAN